MMHIVLFVVRWSALGVVVAGVALFAFHADGERGVAARWRALGDGARHGYATAVERAAPAVVSIRARARPATSSNALIEDPLFRRFFADDEQNGITRQAVSLGSGVILDPTGVVLTNYHVIRGSEAIRIALPDGRSAAAEVVGTDPDTDLAVLKFEMQNLPSMLLGDSDALRVGHIVLAIGNALGIGQTVTQGIVSATGRNRVGINTFENFIQTDAAINFGNSGGALINSRGELVGINSVRLESEGIGFAIPTSIALRIARQILDTGTVERGWIGIDARDLSDSLKRMLGLERGIVVLGVLQGGPGDQAGLKPGDVLTHLGDHAIDDSRAAIERIAAFKPGSRLSLRAVREGQPYSAMVTVSRRPLRE